jgi:hypothetical protein
MHEYSACFVAVQVLFPSALLVKNIVHIFAYLLKIIHDACQSFMVPPISMCHGVGFYFSSLALIVLGIRL